LFALPREKVAVIEEAQKDAFAETMDSQLATKADLMEMENRLIRRRKCHALGQVAIIAALD
jgi:hypothetical protein